MAYVTGDPDVVLERLWREMKAIYEQYSVPHRYVTFGTNRDFPNTKTCGKLKGSAVRCKWMGRVMVDLWKAHMNIRLGIHRKLLICLESSWEMETILDANKKLYKLPTPDAVKLQKASFLMAQSYTEVSEHFHGMEGLRPGLFCRTR